MYQYTEVDQKLVDERVEQFRDQTRRYLAGDLSEDDFLALRLMNGLYVQRHAPMLRVAGPYNMYNSAQFRKLAHIARTYDKGYAHFTTRTNLQFNWPKIEEVPDILAELAQVQMHAIQTSGNCIRNTTTDQFAGVIPHEVEDSRPYCEIIRQWSSLHPEFAYLPRKFKIAISSCANDRAATQVHDIGLHIVKNDAGEVGFEVLVGGGLGRTPMIAKQINPFLAKEDLLSYLEAIIRVYNMNGRRDNKYKARIKILVQAVGIDKFREQVEEEWAHIRDTDLKLPMAEIERVKAFFKPFDYDASAAQDTSLEAKLAEDKDFNTWYERNTVEHKVDGYRIAYVSLKPYLKPAGDITAEQLDLVADLADKYSFGEIRATHNQNLVLADVKKADLYAVWEVLAGADLARPNIGTLTDMTVCPGGDFCALANARTIGVADQINKKFEDMDFVHDLGDLKLNMSGCMNACSHHHVGHIGILGVDKKGEEWYQITIGGDDGSDAALGKVIGRAVAADEVANTLEKVLEVYLQQRFENERFIDTFGRIGIAPFKEYVYAPAN